MTDPKLPNEIRKYLQDLGLNPDEVQVITLPPLTPKERQEAFHLAQEELMNVHGVCRRVTKLALDKKRISALLVKAAEDWRDEGKRGAIAAMIMEAFRSYLQDKCDNDPSFPDEFLAALEKAAEDAATTLQEHHDPRAEPSDSDFPSESPPTS